jgi:hypothetical protein
MIDTIKVKTRQTHLGTGIRNVVSSVFSGLKPRSVLSRIAFSTGLAYCFCRIHEYEYRGIRREYERSLTAGSNRFTISASAPDTDTVA